MSHYESYLIAGVLVPLATFVLLAFLGRRLGKPLSGWAAVGGMGVSLVLAALVLTGWLGETDASKSELAANAVRWHWADLGDVPITVGVKLDSLTVIMFFMVTFIGFWIFVFSVGYMAGHSDEVDHRSMYHRFFTYLSLFAFSMLGLVISSSLLFLFIFWELVGLCSYFLIGFYFDKKYASDAAIKAFVTNRVGDFGFLIGLMLVFFHLKTLDLDQAASEFARQFAADSGIFASPFTFLGAGLATLMGIGLFCGAMGKSAQFPLHVWLPDAMAGPTPVSALIHAATMVAAGVYLVARIFRLLTPDALTFIAAIGCITLTMTALIAMVQTDIKKVLAYSTLSQLGYMIFGMGVGAWIAALFHLMTHAFFKAMLFLGSGQVIEGCHHEQDIRKMGGLRKKMPMTCWTFFIGVLAIAGAGIPTTHLGLGGYFSKDEILAVAYERTYNWVHHAGEGEAHASTSTERHGVAGLIEPSGEEHHTNPEKVALAAALPPLPRWLFWLPIIMAYVTPFYMMRVWWLTFMGKPRDEHVHHHAHESPLMWFPLVVLAAGTVFSSYWLFRPMLAEAAATATDAAAVVAIDGEAHHPAATLLGLTHAPGRDAHASLVSIVGFAFIIGMGLAWLIYRRGLETAERIRRLPGISAAYTALSNKLYFDHLYEGALVPAVKTVLATVCYMFDKYVIDFMADTSARVTERLAAFSGLVVDARGVDGVVNGIAETTIEAGDAVRRPQTGFIRNYILLTAGGAAVVVLVVLIAVI